MESKVDCLINKLDGKRRRTLIQSISFRILEVVGQYDKGATLKEIADEIDKPPTIGFYGFVQALVNTGYLLEVNVENQVRYLPRNRRTTGKYEPNLPLPYYVYDRYFDDDIFN